MINEKREKHLSNGIEKRVRKEADRRFVSGRLNREIMNDIRWYIYFMFTVSIINYTFSSHWVLSLHGVDI